MRNFPRRGGEFLNEKYAHLGTDKRTKYGHAYEKYGCILVSLLNFDQLIPEELETSDFIHASSNWGGRDEVSRTLGRYKARCAGRSIALKNPLIFSGIDYDTLVVPTGILRFTA